MILPHKADLGPLALAAASSVLSPPSLDLRTAPTLSSCDRPNAKSNGFTLVANASDLSYSFSSTIHGWALSSERTAPGGWAAVLSPPSNSSSSNPAFNNGTAAEIAAREGTIQFDLDPPSSPIGLFIEPQKASAPADLAYIHNVGTGFGAGTAGLGVSSEAPGEVYFGEEEGTFVVCNQTTANVPFVPKWPVSWAAKTAKEGQRIPEGCVPFKFLAKCAELLDIPCDGTAEYTHEFAAEVACSTALA